VKIQRQRRGRALLDAREPEPPPSEPQVGARAPGVQARRFRQPASDDFDHRLRRNLRGGQPAPTWSPGSPRH
jgi:hypothetical protein